MLKVEANQLVELKCQTVADLLNEGSFARLFIAGPVEPSPGDVWASYTEAEYDTYEAPDLEEEWGDVTQDEDGVYTSRTDVLTFVPPTAGDPVEVLGVAAVLADDSLAFVVWFDEAFVLEVGGQQLQCRLYYREFAASVLRAELVP